MLKDQKIEHVVILTAHALCQKAFCFILINTVKRPTIKLHRINSIPIAMIKLKKYFENSGFEGDALDKILNSFKPQEFKKYDFFVEEDKICKHLGFVENGMFQNYVVKGGEIRTTLISTENSFLASHLSFASELPAPENVRALTDGNINLISKANLKKLANEIPEFKDFYIALLENSVRTIDASRHDLILLSGEQRYEKMMREEPKLLQQIPLQYLASMLGITPRHLSRIRNNTR